MARKKKKRTSIRTAAGTTQDKFLASVRALAADPLKVLPVSPFGEPGQLVKVRKGVEKVAAGKAGLLVKRDRGIVGAVWQSTQLAELESVPRLIDHKVAGRRRFFLTRGQVNRTVMLGVQNHDDPQVLLMAYRDFAKQHNLHFFADEQLTCTGNRPVPPDSWWEFIGRKAEVEWQDHRCKTCAHPDGDLVELSFPEGSGAAVCENCIRKVHNLHELMRFNYAGPAQRKPFGVAILRGGLNGERLEVERELLAQYRGGLVDEKAILRDTIARWRKDSDGFIMDGQKFGSQDEFMDALSVPDELRSAVRIMTAGGYTGRKATLAAVLAEKVNRLPAAADAIMPGGKEFVKNHKGEPLQVLQDVLQEAKRRAKVADLPTLSLAPIGAWMDEFARAVRAGGNEAGLQLLRKGSNVPKSHQYACLAAIGGDIGLDARFDPADKQAGAKHADLAAALLSVPSSEYQAALATYLRTSGSGETA